MTHALVEEPTRHAAMFRRTLTAWTACSVCSTLTASLQITSPHADHV